MYVCDYLSHQVQILCKIIARKWIISVVKKRIDENLFERNANQANLMIAVYARITQFNTQKYV